MRVLCIDPGAEFSTADVFTGLVGGLRQIGVSVLPYYYGRRLQVMARALELAYKEAKKSDKDIVRPNEADAALWTSELAVTWALRHQPDFVIIVSGMYWHPDAFVFLKRAGFKTGLLLTETPYAFHNEQRFAGLVDVVWTNERTAVAGLRDINPQSYYIQHAYNPEVHTPTPRPDEPAAAAHDVVFVGTGFQERIEWLDSVDWTGIDLGLYGSWTLLHSRSKLRKYVRAGITNNAATAALYRKAKIGVNFFRQSLGFGRDAKRITTAESLNPRSYELAACGCFHISDYRAEVPEIFGDLVPTFKTGKELETVVRSWLADDHGRQQISEQLPTAVKSHSWAARASQMAAVIAEQVGRTELKA